MSFIMKDHFIYLAHPRTASMATEEALSVVCPGGISTKAHHAQLHELKNSTKNSTNNHLYDITGNEYIFTTIRDPLDVLVSWWIVNPQWHKSQSEGGPKGSDGSFFDFINQYQHTYLQVDSELFFQLRAAGHKYMRYEYLQEDFNLVMETLKLPTTTIPKVNITENKNKDFKSMYGDRELSAMWGRFPEAMMLYHTR